MRNGQRAEVRGALCLFATRRGIRFSGLPIRCARRGRYRVVRRTRIPKERAGSLQRFFAATYTHRGIYTQSVRFISGAYGYTVFTRAKGLRELDAGVEVRDRRTGKSTVIACSERPRFYIFELKDLAPCDDETPVGTACVK